MSTAGTKVPKGVCQNFAHLAINCRRPLGLAARQVSGYLETTPPPGKPKLIGADASHAWISLFVPDLGWIDLDPTNNLIPGETHIMILPFGPPSQGPSAGHWIAQFLVQ